MRENIIGAACGAAAAIALAGCAGQPAGQSIQTAMQNMAQSVGAAVNGQPASAPQGQPSAGAPPAGKAVIINGTIVTVDGPRPTDTRWAGKRIEETPMLHYFAKHPIDRPGQYFPRVAIRIDDYSESLTTSRAANQFVADLNGRGTSRPLECLKFDAAVWTSDRQRQDYPGLVLCSSDIHAADPHLTLGALRSYANEFGPVSISSEQSRTMGPRVPSKLLPNFTMDDIQLYSQGGVLFSALFTQLAFTGPIDGDQRLWFVNLAAKPQ